MSSMAAVMNPLTTGYRQPEAEGFQLKSGPVGESLLA